MELTRSTAWTSVAPIIWQLFSFFMLSNLALALDWSDFFPSALFNSIPQGEGKQVALSDGMQIIHRKLMHPRAKLSTPPRLRDEWGDRKRGGIALVFLPVHAVFTQEYPEVCSFLLLL